MIYVGLILSFFSCKGKFLNWCRQRMNRYTVIQQVAQEVCIPLPIRRNYKFNTSVREREISKVFFRISSTGYEFFLNGKKIYIELKKLCWWWPCGIKFCYSILHLAFFKHWFIYFCNENQGLRNYCHNQKTEPQIHGGTLFPFYPFSL